MKELTRGYKLSKAKDEAISQALEADYRGPEGTKLREIDSRNGKLAKGSTWTKMKKGESREIIASDGTRMTIHRK